MATDRRSSSAKSVTSKSVAIISKPGKLELAQIVPDLLQWLREHGYQFVVDQETCPHAPGAEVVDRNEIGSRPLDFVIVLGGDGTLLSAARVVAKGGIPVLGVNLGSLGFLTEVPLEELYPTLEGIDNGSSDVEDRSMVHCEIFRSDDCVGSYDALNDVVVGKSTIARLNHCDVYVDGVFVSGYKADSLIVSSPTGSTAYSLAAGGPILMPSVEAFVITPVSPHTLTSRPVVDSAEKEYTIVVVSGYAEAVLIVDGQEPMALTKDDRITVRRAPVAFGLVKVPGRSYYQTLRDKLRWGTQPSYRTEPPG